MFTNIRLKCESDILDFVNMTNTFKSAIDLFKGSHYVDAKSMLGVIALGIYENMNVRLISTDEDEIVRFINEIRKYEV